MCPENRPERGDIRGLRAPSENVGKHNLGRTFQVLPSLKVTTKATENQWLEDEFPFGIAYFQGRTVSFSECI